eukprot:6192687-Pleurochrysis_carterae.AAC.8
MSKLSPSHCQNADTHCWDHLDSVGRPRHDCHNVQGRCLALPVKADRPLLVDWSDSQASESALSEPWRQARRPDGILASTLHVQRRAKVGKPVGMAGRFWICPGGGSPTSREMSCHCGPARPSARCGGVLVEYGITGTNIRFRQT